MAFIIPACTKPAVYQQLSSSSSSSSVYHQHQCNYGHFTTKRIRAPLKSAMKLTTTMSAVSDSSTGIGNNKNDKKPLSINEKKELSDEEERLQNDKPFMLREFGKVTSVAIIIGLILFFFDILVSIVVLTIGALYGLAVLFDIRFATNFVHRVFKSFKQTQQNVVKHIQNSWLSFRKQIFKDSKE